MFRYYLLILLLPLAIAPTDAQPETTLMHDPRREEAIRLMNDFAARTGLTSERPPKRYLWTDAFAVCNYLGLARITRRKEYVRLALALVDQVQHTLGRHRDDDPRSGWISGSSEHEGERHPTRGGLRIGKTMPERGPGEPFDEHLEWNRDGQYFHYLTKWMHALDQVTRATQQSRYNTWARELSERAFRSFTYQPSPAWEPRRMVWKMSIDLSRPLVSSMGQHDPLDGYITDLQLHATADQLMQAETGPDLADQIGSYADMLRHGKWTTADPLGIGGLLTDAWRLQQLMQQGVTAYAGLHEKLLDAALAGLQHYTHSGDLQLPARHRLAFRELGLAIGLHAVERMQPGNNQRSRELLKALKRYRTLRDDIEVFWRDPQHQSAATWTEHQDINDVMLATSLVPDGFLAIPSALGSE
jgi:hypothetical protein